MKVRYLGDLLVVCFVLALRFVGAIITMVLVYEGAVFLGLVCCLFFCLLCVDVDGVNDEAKLVNDKKQLLCESKHHFLILCV